jgi:FAD synthase
VVEAYLFEEFESDFYGKEMRLMLAGYLRPEAKFAEFPLLLKAIHQVQGSGFRV